MPYERSYPRVLNEVRDNDETASYFWMFQSDIFDEETFYIFVVFFVIGTLIVAYIGSRVITIKPVE